MDRRCYPIRSFQPDTHHSTYSCSGSGCFTLGGRPRRRGCGGCSPSFLSDATALGFFTSDFRTATKALLAAASTTELSGGREGALDSAAGALFFALPLPRALGDPCACEVVTMSRRRCSAPWWRPNLLLSLGTLSGPVVRLALVGQLGL